MTEQLTLELPAEPYRMSHPKPAAVKGKPLPSLESRIAAFVQLTKCSEADARAMIADGRIKP